MDRVLSDDLVIARKDYPCDACCWWDHSGYRLNDCDTEDQRMIVEAAQDDEWRILPGQTYRRIKGVFEGRFVAYRARPGMQAVIEQLDLCDE